jgi:catechol 2,3-dioxygenase-like lactoylglutathione lyase family enzyme
MDVWQMRVVVHVGDVESAVRFYRDALGLRLAERWEQPASGAIFDTGRGQIEVYQGGNGIDESPAPAPTIMLVTADADREYARLASVGVQPLWGPATTAWGTRQFAIQAPDGTTLVFCSPASTPSPPARPESSTTPRI